MDLEQRFAFLDVLPESLFSAAVTTRHGRLAERVTGLLQWREALLQGRLPSAAELAWPSQEISRYLLPRLDVMEMPALCADEQALTDHVLQTLCVAVDSIEEWRERGMLGLFADILEQNRRRRDRLSDLAPEDGEDVDGDDGQSTEQGQTGAGERGSRLGQPGQPDQRSADDVSAAHPQSAAAIQGDLTGESGATAARGDDGGDGGAEIAAGLQQQWQPLIENWRETRQQFDDMGTQLGRGWDLSQGRLRLQGWREFVALRRWIKSHPELIALVNSLGRSAETPVQASRSEPRETSVSDEPAGTISQPVLKPVITDSPTDTRGITRSDEIARMLPQEAAFLGHPVLRGLWHARRAEQALLTYRVQGVMSEHRMEPVGSETQPQPARIRPQQGRGPIMVCVDTSASMHGEPETLAKAVCLEVLRLANQEQRDCLLFAFSGPGQVLEMPLSFSPGGLRELIGFLRQSFSGGTDIAGPLRLALRRSREQRWQRADLLLISDGRFPLSDALASEVSGAHSRSGLRIRGVSVGRWSGRGMDALCDSVLKFELTDEDSVRMTFGQS